MIEKELDLNTNLNFLNNIFYKKTNVLEDFQADISSKFLFNLFSFKYFVKCKYYNL